MNINKNFIGSKMNKSLDERLIPPGEYIDALNIRISSDEDGQSGSAENSKGNEKLTTLKYEGNTLDNAKTIGAYEDSSNETIYWFVTHTDVDMIVSYNTRTQSIIYHVVSETVLNFNEKHRMHGVNLIDNMLFFTDNYNQPRRINISSKYKYPHPISGVDQITEDDISVIVKPPVESPSIKIYKTASKNNYIEDKFIRFAYRYKYKNGEYSAMSEFSELAFMPRSFMVDYGSYDMIGMRNLSNTVDVTFNTGSKNVVGIDLCFKLSTSSIINVVEKFDKTKKEWSNNTDVTVTFDNQKIYTTLPESELLRLYDNTPKFAKAQTSIGNRIMYGNYVDGHDIDTNIDFNVELKSEDIGLQDPSVNITELYDYTIEGPSSAKSDSAIAFDLTGIELNEGGSLGIDLNIIHKLFTGDASYEDGSETENEYIDIFQYTFPRDYVSVEDLATDPDFLKAIELTDIVGFPDTASDGYSLSDIFISNITLHASGNWKIAGSGITSNPQGFIVEHSGNIITLQVPGVQFEYYDPLDPETPTGVFAYEYFEMATTTVSVIEASSTKSLHSNRDYELGIVYLDEYNRASTALVCGDNTVYVEPQYSVNRNYIQARINSLAPTEAKRYRFVLKPSKSSYETLYAHQYYFDSEESVWWLKLEGDNQTKINVGDTLIVKRDSEGPVADVVKTKVLELDTKEKHFIDENNELPPKSGLYMKLRPTQYSISEPENKDIDKGYASNKNTYGLAYPTYIEDPDNPGTYISYDIPAGSEVRIAFANWRNGSGTGCGSRYFKFDRVFTATRDYANIYDFIIGENIDFDNPTNNPVVESSDDSRNSIAADFNPSIGTITEGFGGEGFLAYFNGGYDAGEAVTGIRWVETIDAPGTAGYKSYLTFTQAGRKCNGRNYRLSVHIQVFRAGGLLVFETVPEENTNEIFFESSKSYPIVNRQHMGNVSNQTTNNPAIIDLDFHDCFSFGNGVESFKIDDGLAKPGFKMGARVTAVSEQDYKESHRYANITYSGVYNAETNLNKLNEFNLALVNYKNLENSFGPIEIMHARQSDILVLQEDKISYVLANGKNLFSDAQAGGAILSTPDVLGQQVPRVEENGISNNPESFSFYGSDVFFTDSKRGAVINLKGGTGLNDQLNIISDYGMRSWFRDEFKDNVRNVFLGGYDPYTREYVLSMTDDSLDIQVDTIGCGVVISQETTSVPFTYNVELESVIGDSGVNYNITSGSVLITVTYNGSVVVNQEVTGEGTLGFNKDLYDVNTCVLQVTPYNASYDIYVECIEPQQLTVIRIVKNNSQMEGKTIHHEYFWQDSKKKSNAVEDSIVFESGPVSFYSVDSGVESYGGIPSEGSIVNMKYVKDYADTAQWDNDSFKYLISDTLYTEDEIDTLMPLLTKVSPVYSPETDIYQGSFTYSNPSDYRYLYLVWDYVEPIIECDDTITAEGEKGIYELQIELGTNTGQTTITFNSADIPDRFQLEYNGAIVADSLFVGYHLPDSFYEDQIINETSLIEKTYNGDTFIDGDTVSVNFSASDIADSTTPRPTTGDGSVGDQIGVVAGYPSGTPLASAGDVKLRFNKQYEYPTTVKIIVTGVAPNTGWYITDIECPTGESAPAPCDSGMDVVFLFDYTASMSPQIEATKSGAVDIIDEIDELSGSNDYRLGLVLADEYGIGNDINYQNATGYTSLPSSQKVLNYNTSANRYQVLTAMEMMSDNNETTFTDQIGKINNNSDMVLGDGGGLPEPVDLALKGIVEDNFAGEFRSNVAKYVIIVTDYLPGGDDDAYTLGGDDDDEIQRLSNVCVTKNIKVIVLGAGASYPVWQELATTTGGTYNTSYDASTIISEIQNNCE